MRTLQIFNIETKQKVKSHAMNEDVVFWKWVSDTTIGMVTESAVHHWTISDPTSPPQKVFDRHPTLSGTQIINYRVTPDEKWLVLIGISSNATNPSAFKVKGSMQLYSRDRGVSQAIEGHAAAFAELKLDGHQKPTKLFTFAVRTATGAKVCLLLVVLLTVTKRINSSKSLKLITKLPIRRSRNAPSMSSSLLKRRATSQWPCKYPRSTGSSTSSRNSVSSTFMTLNPVLAFI